MDVIILILNIINVFPIPIKFYLSLMVRWKLLINFLIDELQNTFIRLKEIDCVFG